MKLLDDLVYLAARGFLGLVRLGPRPLSRRLCRGAAGLVYRLDRKHRHIGEVNLSIAFPQRDASWKRATLRESFLQLGDLAVELSRLDALEKEQTLARVTFDEGYGLEHYRAARERAQGGILFLTAHIGPWELLPVVQALHGHPLSFLVRPLDNPRLEAWLRRRRSACGNEVIDKNQSLWGVLRRLKAGRDVGFLIDQNVQPKDGVFAPFFGHPASTSAALAALAIRTGTPVVPGFIHPDPIPGRYRIRFHPPLFFEPDRDEPDRDEPDRDEPDRDEPDQDEPDQDGADRDDPDDDREVGLVAATARFNRAIEDAVRHSPSAWLWGHRRFQTQPDGRDPYRSSPSDRDSGGA